MTDDHDDLDRALFALPLATPPAGLRESILRATIYAPSPARTTALSSFESSVIGAAIAVGVWLVMWLVADRNAAETVTTTAYTILRGVADPTVAVWLALGVVVALVFSLDPRPRTRARGGR